MSASTDIAVVLVLSLLTLIAAARHWKSAKATPSRLRTTPTEKPRPGTDGNGDDDPNQDRRFGDWTPVHFPYPPVTPVTESLDQISPRPYRPYKPGRYHVTMGIRPMEWDSWIELDRDFPAYYRLRAARLASPRGPKLVYTLPDRPDLVRGGGPAARELVHELAEFLIARYPGVYRATRRGSGGEIAAVEVLPVGVTHDLETEDPMVVAAMLTQDDLAIMIEGADGQYYLQAGAVLLAGWWRLEDKIGMPLDTIHTTGNIPHYEEKLQPSLTRFFRRMTPDAPVARNNWLVQVLPPSPSPSHAHAPALEELAWAEGGAGPEDTFRTTPRPAPPPPMPERMRLRVERQTLRRLPRSGAVVFTIRVYLTPLEELGHGEAGRLAAALRGVKEQDVVYRHRRQFEFEDEALKWLDRQHLEEVEGGS
ncbi:hypothetical protein EDB89DRAFT_2134473 [Lactarius sanguifluus]|nr:hypothetical protein EDB89DRAFT_2134473 [Lactarius sanguifluus]